MEKKPKYHTYFSIEFGKILSYLNAKIQFLLSGERIIKLTKNTYLLWLCSVAIVALILEPDENEIILLLDKTRSSIFSRFFLLLNNLKMIDHYDDIQFNEIIESM